MALEALEKKPRRLGQRQICPLIPMKQQIRSPKLQRRDAPSRQQVGASCEVRKLVKPLLRSFERLTLLRREAMKLLDELQAGAMAF